MDVNKIFINSIDDIKKLCSTDILEKRQLILIKNKTPYLKFFIGIIVKYDSNFNVIVRYLDNPLTPDKYWWFGGIKPGVDPLVFSILDFPDLLKPEDMVPDGYDDIINLKKQDIYYIEDCFPYYGGKYGNIYTDSYFKDLLEHNKIFLTDNKELPPSIEKEFKNKIYRKKISKLNDIQDNFKNKDEKLIKKFVSYQLNNATKNNIYMKEKVDLDILENIKNYFKKEKFKFYKNSYDIFTYLKIFAHIFKTRYIIFIYNDYVTNVKIIGNEYENTIYLYKINRLYRIYEYSDEDKKKKLCEETGY